MEEIQRTIIPDGEEIGKNTYRSPQFGDMSLNKLVPILKEQFKAKPPGHTDKKRELVFDKTILDRMRQKYRLLPANETDETNFSLDNTYIRRK